MPLERQRSYKMLKEYVIYTNDNGTDSYELGMLETPEEKYKGLLEQHNDDYYETGCVYVAIDEGRIVECFEVFVPELEEE